MCVFDFTCEREPGHGPALRTLTPVQRRHRRDVVDPIGSRPLSSAGSCTRSLVQLLLGQCSAECVAAVAIDSGTEQCRSGKEFAGVNAAWIYVHFHWNTGGHQTVGENNVLIAEEVEFSDVQVGRGVVLRGRGLAREQRTHSPAPRLYPPRSRMARPVGTATLRC